VLLSDIASDHQDLATHIAGSDDEDGLFCLSKRTPLLNGLGFSGTSY
jgi:hypothetical protein